MLNVANIAACHPNLPKLLMIKLLEPIEIPKTNNSRKIVSDVLFSIFCKNCKLRNTYPIPIPTNIIDIIVNIAINFYSKTYTTRRFHRMRTIMQYIFHRARVWVGWKLGNKLRVSGNLNKSAEPMYMHNEVITQGGISRCKVMYAVCSL